MVQIVSWLRSKSQFCTLLIGHNDLYHFLYVLRGSVGVCPLYTTLPSQPAMPELRISCDWNTDSACCWNPKGRQVVCLQQDEELVQITFEFWLWDLFCINFFFLIWGSVPRLSILLSTCFTTELQSKACFYFFLLVFVLFCFVWQDFM